MPANNIILTAYASLSESGSKLADRIDKQNGIIKNVRVCGLTSPNCPHVPGSRAQPTKGTRYTLEAFKNAAPLYENVKVRLNHAKPGHERDVNESIGVLRNVRVDEGGLRADFHYKMNHRFASELIEDLERDFHSWGLSHVAQGGGPVEDGWLIVKHIPKVRGVDLVDDPATTVSLLESTTVAKIKLADLCEMLLPRVKGKKRVGLVQFMEGDMMTGKKNADGTLCEDEMPMGDMPVDAPPEAPAADSDPDAALMAAFEQACAPLVSAALGGDEDALKKLNEWIKAHIKLASGGDKKAPKKEGDGGGDGEKKEPPAESKESIQVAELTRKLARYENRGKVVTLAESLGCKEKTALPDSLIETLAEVSETRWKPTITDYIARSRGPKSSGPATLPFDVAKKDETPAKVDNFAKAITQ